MSGVAGLKVNYDAEEDILYIIVKDGPVIDSEELSEDVRVEYGPEGEIVGIEITNAKSIAMAMAQEIATIMNK